MDSSREDSKAGQKLRDKLNELRAKYEALKNDPDFRNAAAYDEQIAEMLDSMIALVGDTPINRMSANQMRAVLEVLTALDKTARHALIVRMAGEERDAYMLSRATAEETESVEKAHKNLLAAWLNAQLSPERMFNRLGGHHKDSMWSQVYRMLNDGQLTATQIQMEGSMLFEGLLDGKRYEGFVDPKKTVDIGLKDANGNAIPITHGMMVKFADYLQTRSVGEGAKSILQRFKKVVRFCVSQGLMAKDPCEGVKCIVDDQVLKKDVLSQEEIQRLIDTHYPSEKENVRNAFIFCLYTGMRFCDVKDLRYGSIDYANRLLSFEQDKTKGHSARSWVSIPLNDGLLTLVGKPEDSGKGKEDLIFDLPTYESCCKSVRRWVKRAGIDKHISWHCARHSFAVNILNNGANIKTVASLLGHSGLKHTEKYTRAVDKLKEDAINSLPELKL